VCGESGESNDRGSMLTCCRREDFEKEHQKFGRGIGIAWREQIAAASKPIGTLQRGPPSPKPGSVNWLSVPQLRCAGWGKGYHDGSQTRRHCITSPVNLAKLAGISLIACSIAAAASGSSGNECP